MKRVKTLYIRRGLHMKGIKTMYIRRGIGRKGVKVLDTGCEMDQMILGL